ncbi:MAG: hypothetical protein IIC64_17005 [SAR324 cluster bacterium]|nr:hypothetical protein [SAR324 cluster bacterium]
MDDTVDDTVENTVEVSTLGHSIMMKTVVPSEAQSLLLIPPNQQKNEDASLCPA